jgi:hypothetical protein
MKDVVMQRADVNLEALEMELRAGLGTVILGVSKSGNQIILHAMDSTTQAQQDQAQAILIAHDPTKLTPGQQAEQARQQKLDQLRQAYGTTDLDLAAYSGQAVAVLTLAQKLAWLEAELRNQPGA